MQPRKLRVGAVSYLNSKPLIYHLSQLAPEVDLVLEVPSRLAIDLAEGRLDIGLIPSIEFFRGRHYTILPGASISSFGPVMSVKLCSKIPFAEIKTVAVDEGSRTSIALMKILLHHLFDVSPSTEPFPLRVSDKDLSTDACVIIGDRAMKVADGEYPYTLDLGYEWSRWTGLPFVFAFLERGGRGDGPSACGESIHPSEGRGASPDPGHRVGRVRSIGDRRNPLSLLSRKCDSP